MISFVSAASANANSVNITPPNTNDLILVFAYNNASSTIPSLATGYTSLNSLSSGNFLNLNAARIGYKIASGSETNSGTWTNTTNIVCLVYRGVNITNPIGDHTINTANSTVITYPSKMLQVSDGSSWVVGMAGSRNATSGMNGSAGVLSSNRTNKTIINGLDTNGGVKSFSSQNLNTTGGAQFIAWTGELIATAGVQNLTNAGGIATGEVFDSPAAFVSIAGTTQNLTNAGGIASSEAFDSPAAVITIPGTTLIVPPPGLNIQYPWRFASLPGNTRVPLSRLDDNFTAIKVVINGNLGLSNLALGSKKEFRLGNPLVNGYVLSRLANGTVIWIPAPVPGIVNMQVFTNSGTWIKPAGITEVFIELISGGGGGGGSAWGSVSSIGGGGGGGGAYGSGLFTGITGNITITLGGGGGGGAGGASSGASAGSGANGGTSSVSGGGLPAGLIINGGLGGQGAPNLSTLANGGAGSGIVNGFDESIFGLTGGNALSNLLGGNGGNGPHGGFGGVVQYPVGTGGIGSNGIGPGGGGAGASGTAGTGNAGGNGQKGICIIRW